MKNTFGFSQVMAGSLDLERVLPSPRAQRLGPHCPVEREGERFSTMAAKTFPSVVGGHEVVGLLREKCLSTTRSVWDLEGSAVVGRRPKLCQHALMLTSKVVQMKRRDVTAL